MPARPRLARRGRCHRWVPDAHYKGAFAALPNRRFYRADSMPRSAGYRHLHLPGRGCVYNNRDRTIGGRPGVAASSTRIHGKSSLYGSGAGATASYVAAVRRDSLDSAGRGVRVPADGAAELQPSRPELDACGPDRPHLELGRARRRLDGRYPAAAVRHLRLLAGGAAGAPGGRQLPPHHAPRGARRGTAGPPDRLAGRGLRLRAGDARQRRHRGAAHVVAEGAAAARARAAWSARWSRAASRTRSASRAVPCSC